MQNYNNKNNNNNWPTKIGWRVFSSSIYSEYPKMFFYFISFINLWGIYKLEASSVLLWTRPFLLPFRAHTYAQTFIFQLVSFRIESRGRKRREKHVWVSVPPLQKGGFTQCMGSCLFSQEAQESPSHSDQYLFLRRWVSFCFLPLFFPFSSICFFFLGILFASREKWGERAGKW